MGNKKGHAKWLKTTKSWRRAIKDWRAGRFATMTYLTGDELHRLYAAMGDLGRPQYWTLSVIIGLGLEEWEKRQAAIRKQEEAEIY